MRDCFIFRTHREAEAFRARSRSRELAVSMPNWRETIHGYEVLNFYIMPGAEWAVLDYTLLRSRQRNPNYCEIVIVAAWPARLEPLKTP